jgi:shikimate dehydrogenase
MIAPPLAPAPLMERYAVLGNPVSHSLSPRIHGAFAVQSGQALRYEAVEAPVDGFEATLRRLLDEGLAGANVTVPFKGEAAALADELHPRAARAEAVNTLRREADGRPG